MFAAEFFPRHDSVKFGTRVTLGGAGLSLGPWTVSAREVPNVEVPVEEEEEGGASGGGGEQWIGGGGEGNANASASGDGIQWARRRRLLEVEQPLDVWAVLRNEVVYHLPMPAGTSDVKGTASSSSAAAAAAPAGTSDVNGISSSSTAATAAAAAAAVVGLYVDPTARMPQLRGMASHY